MKYEKVQAEVIQFKYLEFMTASFTSYSPSEAIRHSCTSGYDYGKTNRFTCTTFGGYSPSNPPNQNSIAYLNGNTYEFTYVGANGGGAHWKCNNVK